MQLFRHVLLEPAKPIVRQTVDYDVELPGAMTFQHGGAIIGWIEHDGIDRDLAGIPVIGVLDEPDVRERFPVFKHIGAVRHHLAGPAPVLAEPDGLLVDRHGLLHHQQL